LAHPELIAKPHEAAYKAGSALLAHPDLIAKPHEAAYKAGSALLAHPELIETARSGLKQAVGITSKLPRVLYI
jgi:hypothetical protein